MVEMLVSEDTTLQEPYDRRRMISSCAVVTGNNRIISRRLTFRGIVFLVCSILLLLVQQQNQVVVHGWEWSNLILFSNNKNSTRTSYLGSLLVSRKVQRSNYWSNDDNNNNNNGIPKTLSIDEVSVLRVRDIKRRLTRMHGYSPDELIKMLDKNELISALAYEEEKIRIDYENESKRIVIIQGIVIAIIVVVITYCYPLLIHALDVLYVNCIVFYDRKKYECIRCYTVQSYTGMIGVIIMGILDIIRFWLTVSILLSWFITSKYFFPTPNIPIRASDVINTVTSSTSKSKSSSPFLSSNTNSSSSPSFLSNYGINIGPMLIRWIISFVYSKIEKWTANQILVADRYKQNIQREQQKQQRNDETKEEKLARKEAKRQRKLEKLRKAEAEAEQQQQTVYQREHSHQSQHQTTTMNSDYGFETSHYNQSMMKQQQQQQEYNLGSNAHDEFLQQMVMEHNNNNNNIDTVDDNDELQHHTSSIFDELD